MELIFSLKVIKYFFFIVSIFLLTTGAIVYSCYSDSNIGPAQEYKEKFDQLETCNIDYISWYKEVFVMKYDYYQKNLPEIKSTQKWMLVILIISILIFIFGVDKIPFLGFTIPDNLIYLIIYFGGIYLWANFGLSLNTMIDDRLSLYSYLEVIGPDAHGIEYMNSPNHILLDNSLGDNWFGYYFNIFDADSRNDGFFQFLGLYGIYGVLLGFYMCSLVVSTCEFIERKKLSLSLRVGLLLFVIMMMSASTASFLLKGKEYPILWMGAIWFFASVGLFYWDSQGKKIFDNYRVTR